MTGLVASVNGQAKEKAGRETGLSFQVSVKR